jgi:hypothetical protein
MIGIRLLRANGRSPTAKPTVRPITTAMLNATANSNRVNRSAAGTPLVCHTVPSDSSTRDGGLMNSGSMNQRAAISQAISSSATAPSRTTPPCRSRN